MTLNDLLQITNNLQTEVKELTWHEDDVRHSFFGLYSKDYVSNSLQNHS